jgi:CRP-like cAMP-binding protein
MPTFAAAMGAAGRAFAAADSARALWIWGRVAERFPHDHVARLRVAQALAAVDRRDAAATVYRAAIEFAARSGHPLPAIVACRDLEKLAADTDRLSFVADLYSAESSTLGKRASRLSVDLGGGLRDSDLEPKGSLDAIAEAASAAAVRTDGVRFPDAVHPIPLLSSLPAEGFVRAAREARVLRVGEGGQVFREGDAGHSLLMVAGGQLRVVRGADQELGRLAEGAVFGEMALLSDAPRSATVEVVEDAELLEIGREALQAIGARLPGVREALARFTRERLLANVMATSPLFVPFSTEQRHELLARFTGLEVDPGTVIIRQGETGRGLYVVAAGEVEVVREQPGLDVALARVGAGGLLGEIALVRDRPATATVTATRPSTFLFLEGHLFRRLCAAVPELRAYFEALADDRLREVEMLERQEVVGDFDIVYEED